MKQFEIEITRHCNLNCKSCDHFSPLANKEFISEEVFTNDIKRMSELFSDLEILTLIGGEPLLNPNINFFIKTSRKYFPNTDIRIFTNAILLNQMPQKFWECCSKNHITIEYTYIPLNINRKKYIDISNKYKVKIIRPDWIVNKADLKKEQWRFPLNDKKDKDINHNWKKCLKTHCTSLKNGKLYICPYAANISQFNNFFNKNLEITKEDYIDIYTHTAKEIEEFLKHPKPFCGYCNVDNNTLYGIWEKKNPMITKYELSEWMDE